MPKKIEYEVNFPHGNLKEYPKTYRTGPYVCCLFTSVVIFLSKLREELASAARARSKMLNNHRAKKYDEIQMPGAYREVVITSPSHNLKIELNPRERGGYWCLDPTFYGFSIRFLPPRFLEREACRRCRVAMKATEFTVVFPQSTYCWANELDNFLMGILLKDSKVRKAWYSSL